jgi:tetratricopeptide (TPR) repeat protein
MAAPDFDQLADTQARDGGAAVLERLIDTLRQRREHHRLFDALCLRKKFELGLPLVKPASFDDVPAEQQREFEEAYVAAAREVGEALLAAGNIAQAWVYLRTIREPQKVREAIDRLPAPREASDESEQIIRIALHEGAHPTKGLEFMLRTHGTCGTITALDQMMYQLASEDRRAAAALMVRELHRDLTASVRRDVERKMPLVPPGETLRELTAGREWLFAEGNYHIDVSHLNAVVRFARFLDKTNPELRLAIELADYGSRLAPQLQYSGDAPFEELYPAHVQYFKALAGETQDEAIGYFRRKLDAEPDEQDKPLLAFVLVDLLSRVGRQNEAIEIAERHLTNVDPSSGFSFADLCRDAGRMDVLERVAREKDDLVTYAAALLEAKR